SAELVVPAGPVVVTVTRGPEYRPVRRELRLDARGGTTDTVAVLLDRLADLPALGWWSGDLHVHMNYGGSYRNTPAHLVFQARAEDLHIVENLIVNKEQRIPDIAYFRPGGGSRPGVDAGASAVPRAGVSHRILGSYGTAEPPGARPAPRLRRLRQHAAGQHLSAQRRRCGSRPCEPVLDLYPFASTSPVYATVAGAPVRSRTDAEFFVSWIDRVTAATQAHAGWNTATEKDRVLALLGEARAEYVDRAREGSGR
ncbi:MAG: hypothetical protein ACREMW_06655, partial [Gemmatimonadales bacterium]